MDEEERKKWVYDPDYEKKDHHHYDGSSNCEWWEPLAVMGFVLIIIALAVAAPYLPHR